MNATVPLQAAREVIGCFVSALFRHADEGSFVSLRAFYDDAQQVFEIRAHQLTGDLEALTDAACVQANRAARSTRPVVFAPPIATFSSASSAAEKDLANGLALSVECDRTPSAARTKLEALLGPATVVVASGGEWIDPITGEVEPKLHLHWRLDEPTRNAASHADLKTARSLAMELVGADPTSKPTVHPMRWPGSWHRKGPARLARVLVETEAEIDLEDALDRLREAQGASRADGGHGPGPAEAEPPDEDSGESRGTKELVAAIVTGADYHAPLTALAMRYLKGGMADAQVVLTLRGLMDVVPAAVRDIKDGAIQPDRWKARYNDIPRAVSTARAKLGEAASRKATAAIDVRSFRLDGLTEGPPPRQQYLLKPQMPRGTVGIVFGPGGVGKSVTALDLCLAVATAELHAVGGKLLGGEVSPDAFGASLFLTLEDDRGELHRRTAVLDPQGQRHAAPCFVIPAVDLSDLDLALVRAEGRAAALTEFAASGLEQLLKDTARAAGRPVSLLILDPAGDFLDADENDATYVKPLMRRLRGIASRHRCTIILLGHVAKSIETDGPTMRGSGAWVANSRFAFALWRPTSDEAAKHGRKLGIAADALVWGSLVKANHAGAPVGKRLLFRRDPGTGRLIDVTSQLNPVRGVSDEQLLEHLVQACAEYAAAGLPFSYSGVGGLWNGRADLPTPLCDLPKNRLEGLCQTALERGVLVKARTTHTQGAPKYLDVPEGPLATGQEVPMFQGSRQEALAHYRGERAGANQR